MRIKIENEKGNNIINSYEIDRFIKMQVEMIPGVTNLASKSVISPLINLVSPDITRGVEVVYLQGNRVGISVYVVVNQDMNFIRVTNSIQEILKYTVSKKYGLKVKFVDVHVKGIK